MWLIPTLFSTITNSFQNVYIKHSSVHFNTYITVWVILVISSLLFSPLLLLGIPKINILFWIAVIIRLFVDSIGFILYVKGLRAAPLSLAIPMTSFTPLFLLMISFFVNHLFPSTLGIIGILLTIFGVYFLNFDHDTKHILSPFHAIKNNVGLQYLLLSSIFGAVTISMQKLAIDNSSPYFYTAFFQLVWAICFTPIAFFINRKEFMGLFTINSLKKLFPIGSLDALQVFGQNIALTMTLPVYMQSVQNAGILFSSFFGWYFFKEKIEKHILPTIIIIAGITLISFAQK